MADVAILEEDSYDKVAADLKLSVAEVDALLCANRSGRYWSVERPMPWYEAETWSVLVAGNLAFRDRVSATSGYYFLTDQAKGVYAQLDPISARLKAQLDAAEMRVNGYLARDRRSTRGARHAA